MEIPTWTYRFLVEVWAEPRDIEGLPFLVRGRVRDMEQKKEHYVASFAEVERVVERCLDDAGVTPRRWERDA